MLTSFNITLLNDISTLHISWSQISCSNQCTNIQFNSVFLKNKREREIKVKNSTKPKFLIQSTRSILRRIIWKTRNIWLVDCIYMYWDVTIAGEGLHNLGLCLALMAFMLWQPWPESLTAFIKRLHCKPATRYWGQRTYSKKKKKKNPTAYIIEHSWGYN